MYMYNVGHHTHSLTFNPHVSIPCLVVLKAIGMRDDKVGHKEDKHMIMVLGEVMEL
jgi:hypothetical protein